MMKKWGLLFLFLSSLTVSTDVFSQYGSGDLPCCWRSQIHESPECCVDGAWGNEERFEWRIDASTTDGGCCSQINVTEAYPADSSGEFVRGAVVTQTCCESQGERGASPGNYKFWPTSGSQNLEDDPDKGGICCIKDSWKFWSTGSNNRNCCKAQGGEEHSKRCCFQAYDLEKDAHSKECCKQTDGKWENGDCCASATDGTAMANKIEQTITADGKVEVTYSGVKVTKNCCIDDDGETYNKAFDSGVADLGCCINGTVYGLAYNDSSESDVIEDCCENSKTVTELGSLDACCASGEEGYVKKTKQSDGTELKSGACCNGDVYIKTFVKPKKNTDGSTNYGNMECCETGKFAIGGACCQNSDDKEYPDGDYYSCCPSSNLADASNVNDRECCEDPTSPRNVNGKPTQACCENAYGEWVSGNKSSAAGDPDQEEESSASCCKGSMDIMTGSRTEACCQNAGGKWMDNSFCCITWGKKVNGACVADGLPEEEGEQEYAGPLGGR